MEELEKSVGIVHGLTTTSRCIFKGVFKQKYSDFIVNEIDEGGKIHQLLEDNIPERKQTTVSYDLIKHWLTSEMLVQLERIDNDDELASVEIDVTNVSKDILALIHNYIRQNYINLSSQKFNNMIIVTNSTMIKNANKKSKFINQKNPSSIWRSNNIWPYGNCKYVHFVLYKENMTTNDAIIKISKMLRVNSKRISFAGNKDKQAKTNQRVSIYKVEPSELVKVNKLNSYMHNSNQCLLVGNFNVDESNKEISLGNLKGNNFIVAIRDFDFMDKVIFEHYSSNKYDHLLRSNIQKLLEDLEQNGFINYYGLQRFGVANNEAYSYKIGICILKKDYKGAVNIILREKPFLSANLNNSLNIWHKLNDPIQAYSLLNRKSKEMIEGQLLTMLKNDHPNYNYKNMIMKLHRNTRNLYIHAYQSYLWNKIVTHRIIVNRFNVLINDIVYDMNLKPHKITQADLNSNTYSIDNVYMPLPNGNLSLPENLQAYALSLLEEDHVELSYFSEISKDFNVTDNTHRKIVVKPTDLTWQLVDYYMDNDILIEDTCTIKNLKHFYNVNVDSISVQPDITITNDLNPPRKALILKFNLPSSSYATILLGEIIQNIQSI